MFDKKLARVSVVCLVGIFMCYIFYVGFKVRKLASIVEQQSGLLVCKHQCQKDYSKHKRGHRYDQCLHNCKFSRSVIK